MTIFERLELIRAGYKRVEIDAMLKADEEAAKATPPELKEESKQPEKAEEPKQPEKAETENEEVQRLKAEIEQLRKEKQLQNIKSIGLSSSPDKPVEEVLAEAIFGNESK